MVSAKHSITLYGGVSPPSQYTFPKKKQRKVLQKLNTFTNFKINISSHCFIKKKNDLEKIGIFDTKNIFTILQLKKNAKVLKVNFEKILRKYLKVPEKENLGVIKILKTIEQMDSNK